MVFKVRRFIKFIVLNSLSIAIICLGSSFNYLNSWLSKIDRHYLVILVFISYYISLKYDMLSILVSISNNILPYCSSRDDVDIPN